MTARQVRELKLGEVVGASGHRGVFRIIAINSASRTADLKLIGGSETEICGVPWTTLRNLCTGYEFEQGLVLGRVGSVLEARFTG